MWSVKNGGNKTYPGIQGKDKISLLTELHIWPCLFHWPKEVFTSQGQQYVFSITAIKQNENLWVKKTTRKLQVLQIGFAFILKSLQTKNDQLLRISEQQSAKRQCEKSD